MPSDTDWPDLGLEITLESLSQKLARLDRAEVNTYTGCLRLHLADGTSEEFHDPVLFAFYDFLSWRWQADPFAPDIVSFEAYQLWKAEREKLGEHFFVPSVLPGGRGTYELA